MEWKTTGSLYCRPEKRGKPLLGKTSGKYCPKCGFKVRGSNHAQGKHHIRGVNKSERICEHIH